MVSADIWGPITWSYLHNQAHCYSENPNIGEKLRTKNNIEHIIKNIPCNYCNIHANEYLYEHPLTSALESRHALITYFWKFHNSVRQKQKKRTLSWNDYMQSLAVKNIKTYQNPTPDEQLEKIHFVNLISLFLLENISYLILIILMFVCIYYGLIKIPRNFILKPSNESGIITQSV